MVMNLVRHFLWVPWTNCPPVSSQLPDWLTDTGGDVCSIQTSLLSIQQLSHESLRWCECVCPPKCLTPKVMCQEAGPVG